MHLVALFLEISFWSWQTIERAQNCKASLCSWPIHQQILSEAVKASHSSGSSAAKAAGAFPWTGRQMSGEKIHTSSHTRGHTPRPTHLPGTATEGASGGLVCPCDRFQTSHFTIDDKATKYFSIRKSSRIVGYVISSEKSLNQQERIQEKEKRKSQRRRDIIRKCVL